VSGIYLGLLLLFNFNCSFRTKPLVNGIGMHISFDVFCYALHFVLWKKCLNMLEISLALVILSDCSPGIEFSIPGSGIEKFVIPGSRFRIRLIDWSSFWYSRLTYSIHSVGQAPTENVFELQGVMMTVKIRMTVHSKEWNSSAHK